MRGISWLAENRLASQEGLCFVTYGVFNKTGKLFSTIYTLVILKLVQGRRLRRREEMWYVPHSEYTESAMNTDGLPAYYQFRYYENVVCGVPYTLIFWGGELPNFLRCAIPVVCLNYKVR